MIDRTEVSRAFATAIAYQQCAKRREAEEWGAAWFTSSNRPKSSNRSEAP